MQFSRELRDAVRSGAITVSYRLWQQPQVKLGGRHPFQDVFIEVDSVEQVPFSSVDDTDLALTGERDFESVRRRAAHAGSVYDDTLLYRIEFHIV